MTLANDHESKPVEGDEHLSRSAGGAPCIDDLFLAFLRLGCVSFGGPAMVAYIKRFAVVRKLWGGLRQKRGRASSPVDRNFS